MQTIDFPTVKKLYAAKANKDEATAAKQMRSRLRSNFAKLAEVDPTNYGSKGTIKERANDQRPWGPLPVAFVRDVLGVEVKPARAKKQTAAA